MSPAAAAVRSVLDGAAAEVTVVVPAPVPDRRSPAPARIPMVIAGLVVAGVALLGVAVLGRGGGPTTGLDSSALGGGQQVIAGPGRSSDTTTTSTTAPSPTTATADDAGQQPSTTSGANATESTSTTASRRTTTDGRATTATAPTTTRRPTTTVRPSTTRRTTTTMAPTTPTAGSGGVIWQDDFDRLDTSTWRLEHSTYGDGNNELQCYRPGNVSVGGGKLILRARTETVTCPNGSTRQVSSGMVRSQGVSFSPGQAIEFRVKLTPADPDDQGGLWPAVWASGWAGGGWPAGGELDWLEVMTAEDPTRAMFSLHHAGPDGSHRLQNRGVRGATDFSAAWHTVRFDYGRDGDLRWYLDGAPAFAVDAADTLQGYPAPFDQTIREIKINLALGGRPGPLAAGAVGSTGATFEVDYIRIIQL